jgi:uncharacterized membrane protein YesL
MRNSVIVTFTVYVGYNVRVKESVRASILWHVIRYFLEAGLTMTGMEIGRT